MKDNDKPINSPFELFEALRQLIQRGRQGGLDPLYLDLLFSTGEGIMERINHNRQENAATTPHSSERRHKPRIAATTPATAVYQEEAFPVEVLDLGAHGFGIRSATPVPSGSFLILETPGPDGEQERFSCFVAFCREKEGSHRMGLRIFAKLPRDA